MLPCEGSSQPWWMTVVFLTAHLRHCGIELNKTKLFFSGVSLQLGLDNRCIRQVLVADHLLMVSPLILSKRVMGMTRIRDSSEWKESCMSIWLRQVSQMGDLLAPWILGQFCALQLFCKWLNKKMTRMTTQCFLFQTKSNISAFVKKEHILTQRCNKQKDVMHHNIAIWLFCKMLLPALWTSFSDNSHNNWNFGCFQCKEQLYCLGVKCNILVHSLQCFCQQWRGCTAMFPLHSMWQLNLLGHVAIELAGPLTGTPGVACVVCRPKRDCWHPH